jgi:hypothetical protein
VQEELNAIHQADKLWLRKDHEKELEAKDKIIEDLKHQLALAKKGQ